MKVIPSSAFSFCWNKPDISALGHLSEWTSSYNFGACSTRVEQHSSEGGPKYLQCCSQEQLLGQERLRVDSLKWLRADISG